MTQWLLERLFEATDQTQPRFAFQGTVNWMRALSILVDDGFLGDTVLKTHYKKVIRRKVNRDADTHVFENMLMAFHNHASLVRLNQDATRPYDICRSAIISWYYSIYFTASAMIAATSGAMSETHSQTAKIWQNEIVDNGFVLPPFSLTLSSLVERTANEEILAYRKDNVFDLNTYPETVEQAWGAIVSYLKGTWDYEKWRVEERVKGSPDFRALSVDNFRKKAARQLRDNELAKHTVNFLIQAFRYRGKANYRDSIFLSYGDDNTEKIKVFLQDLERVSFAFQRTAAFYISKRVEKDTWEEFIDDLEENSRLSIDTRMLAL